MSSGVEIVWQDLEVRAPLSRTEKKQLAANNEAADSKVILNKISGRIMPNSMTAILGPSGCGKTTLLNYLAKRRYFMRNLTVTGGAFLNGHPIEELDFNNVAGYVMQDDVILPIFTVREVLVFTAKMSLPSEKVNQRVDKVIKDLSLEGCQNTVIGNEFNKGISGGERKRTSIAIELLIDPLVLFLDEPTTGLDSYNAEKLVIMLNELAKQNGLTIAAVIHQPNSFIFSQFEFFILMTKGNVIYNGPANQSIEGFSNIGYPAPKFTNPAEYFMDLATPSFDDPEKIDRLLAAVPKQSLVVPQPTELPPFDEKYSTNFFHQLWLLGLRALINLIRNRVLLIFRVGGQFLSVLLSLIAYYQIIDDEYDDTSVVNRAGLLLFLLTFTAFVSVNTSAAYADEKAMFLREQSNKTYSVGAFYLSKILFDAPPNVIVSIGSMMLCYLVIGFSTEDADQIWVFAGIIGVVNMNGLGWGYLLIMAIPAVDAAIAIAPFVLILQFLVGGLLINFDNIPVYYKWLEYISMFKYSWSAAMLNEFDTFDEGKCGEQDICDAEDFYNLESLNIMENILILTFITTVLHFLAFLALWNLARKFRN